MATSRKLILKEINLWKKRYQDSRKVLNSVYKDVQKEAKRAIKEASK